MSDIMSYFNNASFTNAVEVLMDNLDKNDKEYNLEKIVHMVSILYDNGLLVDIENNVNNCCNSKCKDENINNDNVETSNEESFENRNEQESNDSFDSEPVDFIEFLGNGLKNVLKSLDNGDFVFFDTKENNTKGDTTEEESPMNTSGVYYFNPFYAPPKNSEQTNEKAKLLKDDNNHEPKKDYFNDFRYVHNNPEDNKSTTKQNPIKPKPFAKMDVTQDEYVKIEKAAEMLGMTLNELVITLPFTSRFKTYKSPVTGAIYLRKNDIKDYLEDK